MVSKTSSAASLMVRALCCLPTGAARAVAEYIWLIVNEANVENTKLNKSQVLSDVDHDVLVLKDSLLNKFPE